jgi:hypothetical protein
MKLCGKVGCEPRLRNRDGADHTGIDVFVKCAKCGIEGPYIECVRSDPSIRSKVTAAWNDDLSPTNGETK